MASVPFVPNVTTTVRKAHNVKTISGYELPLQTESEQKFYNGARDKYLSENTFTAASDFRALDRLLLLEVQVFRWQWQLAAGLDYNRDFLDAREEAAIQKALKESGPMISALQNDLGLTKNQRDKQKHDSVGAYLTNLKIAAKAHGVNREKQLGKALELTKELFNVAGAYRRSNDAERIKLGFESAEDVVDYILEIMKPAFDEVDAYYRLHEQRFFIRNL